MDSSAASLVDRAGRMYRLLLLLQPIFQASSDDSETHALQSDDTKRDVVLREAVREVLDELVEHARVLTSVPFPVSEWRPGDESDDERWRALTEVERREVLSLVSGYENLIAWGERLARRSPALEALQWPADAANVRHATANDGHEPLDYLRDERARLSRFRHDMGFLDRRRAAS